MAAGTDERLDSLSVCRVRLGCRSQVDLSVNEKPAAITDQGDSDDHIQSSQQLSLNSIRFSDQRPTTALPAL